jgi:hypothetical protein
MALWLLKQVDPCFSYTPYTGYSGYYWQELITPPRHFEESLWWVNSFYYVPQPYDLLCAWLIFKWIRWPSWNVKRYDFDAETGELKNIYDPPGGMFDYIDTIEVGGYGTHYASFNSTLKIKEVSWETRAPVSGGFETDLGVWAHNPIVNRQDGLLGFTSSWHFEVWDYLTKQRLWWVRLPTQAQDGGWENRERCWLTLTNGQVVKINYKYHRVELMSSVQGPLPDDVGYFCAFDQLRGRLAIFRHRPDAVDGACQCRLEFYRPIPKVAILTDPVPIRSPRVGKTVPFISHLAGDAGEGLGSYLVEASLLAPAQGQVLSPTNLTGQEGQTTVHYRAPTSTGTDTLQVETEVTEAD